MDRDHGLDSRQHYESASLFVGGIRFARCRSHRGRNGGRHGPYAGSRAFFVSPVMVVLVVFAAWMCVTLPASIYPSSSYAMWKQVMKIDFMIVVAAMVLTTRKHIMALAWVLVVPSASTA